MKKITLFLFSLIVIACSTDSSDDDGSFSAGKILKKVTKYNSGIAETETFYEYNTDDNISKITSTNIYGAENITNFIYDGGLLTSFIEESTDPFGDLTTETNSFYYESGLVVRICQDRILPDGPSSFDDPEVDRIDFDYDELGNVNLFTHYYPEDSASNSCDDVDDIDSTEDLVYDSNGNTIRYENSNYFFTPTYLTYTYENTNNPFSNIKPETYRKLYGFSTVNNISEAIEYNSDSDEATGLINYDYEYNSEKFPTKLTRTYSTPGGGISQTVIYEYEYY